MARKMLIYVLLLLAVVHLGGCAAVLAGAAGSAGTAVWLSGKLSREVDASFAKAVRAVHSGLEALDLKITKETKKDDVVQVIAKYFDGRTVWIDIRPLSNTASRLEIRVGITSDKEAAGKILEKIEKYL